MIKLVKRFLNKWAALGAVLFMIVQVITFLYLPTLTAGIINQGIAKHDINYIIGQGVLMFILSILSVIAAGGNIYFAATQSQLMGKKIRSAIYRKVIYFSEQDLSKFGDSSLITRATNDVVQIQNVMVNMLRMMIMSPIMLVTAIVLAFTMSPKLTLIFVLSLVILVAIIYLIMGRSIPLFKSIQTKTDDLNLTFREGLTGVRVIRAFNRDDYEQKRFDHYNRDYMNTGLKVYRLTAMMFPLLTVILNFTNIGIVWFGSQLIASHSFAVGNLVAFMSYSTQILISFTMLSFMFVFLPRASASAARINEVLDHEDSITDSDQPVQPAKQAESTLSFNDVSYRYEHAEECALSDVSFNVHAGQTLAIIGGTGSGKSTLVNLIPRLIEPEQGSIKIDGVDVAKMSQFSLHQLVSITQQKAVLFAGTVRSNMQFGNREATDDQIWHALEVAQAADFIKAEAGLDTRVEQNGENFSGGQRQRLAIARTIIKDAQIYVFDDSFSALDFKTDAKLRGDLHADPKISRAISVIVAQRVSTIANADEIIVLDDGKVVGQGTHQQLLANNETYQSIVNSQIRTGGASHAEK
ncbi:ABC transporter ATP-binding protein/permease [Nicoliella spurrieriana]|uniref:ABC transporter ATP-binding protein/permease n=1 Tax=Nicoliella spurrieriana TaxID=2925830 RepID=A0A976X5L8_9LACO|nr:ABC transporter ATP-binding protein [Nicoliella spurrieriana]UQS86851.1 ABC transporter ATP-binding protein/permease [Nicoliella spurrieriana]